MNKMNKIKKNIFQITIVFLLILALSISIEQYIRCGSFFQFNDMHHETFIVALLFGAILTYFLYEINKRKLVG